MNKYQEALEKIVDYEIDLRDWYNFVTVHIKDNNGTVTIGDIIDGNLSDEWLNLVTLVERATPKKPKPFVNGGFQCPSCESLSIQGCDGWGCEVSLNFCNDCGQALDWKD